MFERRFSTIALIHSSPSFSRSLIPKRMGILRSSCRWPHFLTRYTYHATVSSVREAESTSTSPSPLRSMPNTENAPSVAIEMTFEPSAAYGPEGGEAERPTWMRIRRTKEQLIDDANPQTQTKERIERRRTEIKHKLGALLLLSSATGRARGGCSAGNGR